MKEKKILIVDGEGDIRKVFEKAFRRAGYAVRTAASGSEALEILKGDKIQVMFFDLKMPEMDGLELCREVRKDFPMAMILRSVDGSRQAPKPAAGRTKMPADRSTRAPDDRSGQRWTAGRQCR